LAIHLDADRHEVRMEGQVALHEAPTRPGAPSPNAYEGLWAWVWPNLGFSLYRDVLLIEHMRPSGPGRTQLDHIYLHQPEDPGIDAATLTSERITHEDAAICARVQENLNAGVYGGGPLSPTHEGAVAWFQNAVASALGG
jgi:choline monooxygenase